MLTGDQVRQACALLKWTRYDLQRHTALRFVVIDCVLRSKDSINATLAEKIIVKEAFHRSGVEFIDEGPRLRRG